MHPEMTKLMVLQGTDIEMKRLRDEMAALPKQVTLLETKAKAVEGQRAVVLDLIAKEEAMRRRQESDVKDLQAKIVKLRRQMDQATTSVQVTAYEHEIAFAEKAIGTLEDAELESLERTDVLEQQRRVADAEVEAARRKHQQESERGVGVLAAGKEALTKLETQRVAQRDDVDEEMLGRYDRIARAKGTAVAEAQNQRCGACQMMLRPQRWNDLRERDNHEVMSCESCSRLLYYDPARDAPQRKPMATQESVAARIVRGL